jgi:ribosome recycling factor
VPLKAKLWELLLEVIVKLAELKEHMQKTIESTQKSFNTLRTGRANGAILDRVTVEYYGAETPLKSLATISTPDGTTIAIQPFDRSSMGSIEKAILMSDIGLTPNNDGQTIRLNIPPLTSERRQELVKMANKMAEEGKVALRNIRRDAMDAVKKQAKNHDISEDEAKDLEDQIQKTTNLYVNKIDEILAAKEKDIKTI